jgi:hypothetical protein
MWLVSEPWTPPFSLLLMFVLVENNLITEIAVAMDTAGVGTLVDEPSTPQATSSPSIEQNCGWNGIRYTHRCGEILQIVCTR